MIRSAKAFGSSGAPPVTLRGSFVALRVSLSPTTSAGQRIISDICDGDSPQGGS